MHFSTVVITSCSSAVWLPHHSHMPSPLSITGKVPGLMCLPHKLPLSTVENCRHMASLEWQYISFHIIHSVVRDFTDNLQIKWRKCILKITLFESRWMNQGTTVKNTEVPRRLLVLSNELSYEPNECEIGTTPNWRISSSIWRWRIEARTKDIDSSWSLENRHSLTRIAKQEQ